MKFFIFTCLLAVALANNEIKQSSSSSEESASIYQEETANKIETMQSSSSSSNEESAQVSTEKNELTKEEIYLKQMESTSISQEESAEVFPEMTANQFLQKFAVPQYVQAVPLAVYQPVESHSGKHLPIYSNLEELVRFLN
nr:alpha-S2-casein-like A [Aotus nancymaae]